MIMLFIRYVTCFILTVDNAVCISFIKSIGVIRINTSNYNNSYYAEGVNSVTIAKIVITMYISQSHSGVTTGSGTKTVTIEYQDGSWTTPSFWFGYGGSSTDVTITSIKLYDSENNLITL